jgi:hypothetical protein
MRGQSILQSMRNGLGHVANLSTDGTGRVVHGGSAWSLPRGLNGMRQPQDGASPTAAAPSLLTTTQRHGHMLLEPEDARITGGTRSLTRRLLGLNVTDAPRKPVVAVAKALPRQRIA